MISKRFESIGKEYSDFTIIVSSPFYDLIRRSKSRSTAVKKVAQQSKQVAQLFEKYTKNPNSYSAVQSRLQINTLIADLENLRTALRMNATESDGNLGVSVSSRSNNINETSGFSGFLNGTSKHLNMNIDNNNPEDRSRLFYETLLTIQNELYQQSLGDLTKDFLSVLETDIRTIISGMKDLFLRYREIGVVQQHLEKGYSDIVVSLKILDDISIEPDRASRVKRSADSIMNFRKELDKAILYWPGELVRAYSTNIDAQGQSQARTIESASANTEASDNRASEPPPDLPDRSTPEPLPPEPQAESSEIISQYTIQDNALEKHAATDKPIQNAEQDKLGFGVYVTALHDFIVSQYTTTPLTISVDGPWGTGKSSLMYMLKNILEPQINIWQRFVAWLKTTIRWWGWFFWWFLALPVQTFGRALLRVVLKFDKNTQEFDFRVGKNNPRFRSLNNGYCPRTFY